MAANRADVARLAGTSPAVVSYVLNGGPRPVAPATRERVLAAVRQLGYRPNAVARSLRMSRTMALGLIVPDTANPFFAELARTVEDAAFAEGYTLLLGNAVDDVDREASYVRTFIDRQVDGLVIIPAHGPQRWLEELRDADVPCVVLDRRLDDVPVAQVVADSRAGARLAVEHLLDHGHRDVACLAGPDLMHPTTDRVEGWRDALLARGVDPEGCALRFGRFGAEAGYAQALELLADPATRPAAVFVASDEQASGLLRAAGELGVRVPADVAVVSFDGITATRYTAPPLTTVRQPFAELGRTTMRRLVDLVHGRGPAEPSLDVLPVTLLPGGSCGCAEAGR